MLSLVNHLKEILNLEPQESQAWDIFDKIHWDLSSPKSFPFYSGSYDKWLALSEAKLSLEKRDRLLLISSWGNQGLAIDVPQNCRRGDELLHFIRDSYMIPITRHTCTPQMFRWIEDEIHDRWKPSMRASLIKELYAEKLYLRDLLGDHSHFEGISKLGSLLTISFGS